jgi:hypothetical protein
LFLLALAGGGLVRVAAAQTLEDLKHDEDVKGGRPIDDFLSSGGMFAVFGPGQPVQSPGELNRGGHDNGRGGNTFVNDPCLDPNPPRRDRTVQSETEIAVLNTQGSMGKRMVAGWNDSYGFYNNTKGLSGFGYSTNGGSTWIDGGGLPPLVPSGAPAGTPGSDAYFGDPVIVVHHGTGNFYYASIYLSAAGYFTLSVNRGHFQTAPPQGVESVSNTRCANDPTQNEIPDPPANQKERIIWDPPVEAVPPPFLGAGNLDFLDKEWLYVDQSTGELYLTYTRFADDGSTPIELVRSMDQGQTWTPPSVIVPNEAFDFNQATQPFTTPTGRVIVTWIRRRFATTPPFAETENAIEYAYSDDDGVTFTTEKLVAIVNPQGEPLGYNRGRATILNAPYLFVDRGADDGVNTPAEMARPGFGNVYITYFNGKTLPPASTFDKAADILLSTSTNNGTSFGPPVKVNDDGTNTSHVFPSVQANKLGDVYVAWVDRRQDPANVFNDVYAAVSKDQAASFGHNKVQTKVSTSWFVRADARPNFGDYNSSELLGFNQFVTIWADGRFPLGTFESPTPPSPRLSATPDVIFTIANGLGVGGN